MSCKGPLVPGRTSKGACFSVEFMSTWHPIHGPVHWEVNHKRPINIRIAPVCKAIPSMAVAAVAAPAPPISLETRMRFSQLNVRFRLAGIDEIFSVRGDVVYYKEVGIIYSKLLSGHSHNVRESSSMSTSFLSVSNNVVTCEFRHLERGKCNRAARL